MLTSKTNHPHSIGIRVDADSQSGFGHIVRCLLLAKFLRQKFRAKIIFFTKTPSLADEKIKKEGFVVKNLPSQIKEGVRTRELLSLLTHNNIGRLIIDIPRPLSATALHTLKKSGKLIILLDDVGPARNNVDLCINAIDHLPYKPGVSNQKNYVEGPQFMIIKPEYVRCRKMRPKSNARRILITFGGGDFNDLTGWTLKALTPLANSLELACLIGPGYKYKKRLQTFIANQNIQVEILSWPSKPIQLFKKFDMAITHFGIGVYELASMGLPTVLIQPSKYHSAVADVFAKRGSTINLGYYKKLDKNRVVRKIVAMLRNVEKRNTFSKIGRTILDGQGLERTAKLIWKARSSSL